MPIQEVRTIPDIRERNDRPKDKQPKHQVTSTIQRQMVQKFVKELSDSAKYPDRSDSAEHTATEQVETTAREIAHEAVQLPRGFSHRTHYTESTEHLQPEQPISPRPTSEIPRQRTETVRARPDTTPAPTPQEQGRRAYIQQAAKAAAAPRTVPPEQPQNYHTTPEVSPQENVPHQNLQSPRHRTNDFRTRPESRAAQSVPAPTPQEQGRRAYVQQAAKAAAAPPITPESPQKYPTTLTTPTLKNAPRQAPETPRLRADDVRLRPEPDASSRKPTPAPQELGRRAYVQKAAKDTTKTTVRESLPERPLISDVPPTEKSPRLRTEDVRTRSDMQKPQNVSVPTPQEQGRRSYVQQAKKSRAEKTSAQDIHTEPPEIRLAEDIPEHELPHIREKSTLTELRGDLPPEPSLEKAPNVRHIKQAGAWTPRAAEPSTIRGEELPIRERTADTPTHNLPSIPQAQARKIFAEKQAQRSQDPSIESIHPPESAAPVPPQLPVSDVPANTPERQPVTVGSNKSTPQPVQQPTPTQAPPVEQLPAIREKPKPNAALREKSQRGVSIRTRDAEQTGTPKVPPKTSVSKIDTKRARKAATQDAQRKMLQKNNKRAAKAAVAAAKKLGEAAAKAAKELIDALIALGGGTALFIVFSIVIVAGAFLASPLGILFADEQQTEDTVPLATAIAEIDRKSVV